MNLSAGTTPVKVVVADFNGDGELDLAVANYNCTNFICVGIPEHDVNISVLLSNGDGTFQTPLIFSSGDHANPLDATAADLNGDGTLDLVVANIGGSIAVLLGNGDGTFRGPRNFDTPDGRYTLSIALADFNGDGKLDVVAANANSDNISVLRGNGDGTFQQAVYFSVGHNPYSVAVGDFNGDGKHDLVSANATGSGVTGTISILVGNGNGTFQPPVTYSLGLTPSYLSVGDFNGDNKLDLAVANVASNFGVAAGAVSVLINNTPSPSPSVGGSVTGVSQTKVICRNLTTPQRVVIKDGAHAWDCEAAGLSVTPGDITKQTVTGPAD